MADAAPTVLSASVRPGSGSHSRSSSGFRRAWKLVTYLLAMVSFGALFVTKELHPVTSLLFVGGWLAGYKIDRAPDWFRPWFSTVLTLAAVVVIAFVAWVQFFQGVLNLLLFLLISKLFMLRGARDFLQAEILCFFVILSTAVITVSFYFVFFFLAYVLLAVAGLGFYGIGRRLEASTGTRLDRIARAAAPPRMIRWAALATGASLTLAAGFFVLLPHYSTESMNSPLSRRDVPQDQLTGFSDDLTFGTFKQITPDQTVVMRVEPGWPEGRAGQRPTHLMMRGLALDHYDEDGWRRAVDRNPVPMLARKLNIKVASVLRGDVTNLTVYQNPEITMRVFTAPFPIEVDLGADHQVRQDAEAGGLQVVQLGSSRESAYTNPFTYKVNCNLIPDSTDTLPDIIRAQRRRREIMLGALALGNDPERRTAYWAALRRGGKNLGVSSWTLSGKPTPLRADERLAYLELPETQLTKRIRELSLKEIPGPTAAEMILQATNYVRRNHSYTLAPETPPGMRPLEAFLFSTHKGHCEYFASALALMLRTRGVPTRIVNGFHTSDWNSLADVFVVKQSDAHSWVEAWLDDIGWIVVDPTPPGSIGRAAYGLLQTSVLGTLNDYFRIQWQRAVIDYNADKRLALRSQMSQLPGIRVFSRGFGALRDFVAGQKSKADPEAAPKTKAEKIRRFAGWMLDAATLGLAAAGLRRGAKLVRGRARGGRRRSGIDFFDAALDRIERTGLRRRGSQTPAEFVAEAAAAGWDGAALGRLLDLYHLARYSGQRLEREPRREAARLARALRAPAAPGRADRAS